ncbi:DMT family transporter [Sulfuracidifex metallicus]|uniref:DMT family transporter n=1 Tax=Sulfuracidifex metallicus TaxID=47303 RepID=UPI002275E617|nr:EamA family transporter [Sulfuracidifex metallicus]MCY0850650.1 EamA family transporter [Sulfuracidifex metallicus]
MAVTSRGLRLVVLLALVWGSSYPLIKITAFYASPVIISLSRVIVSSIFFLAVTRGKMQRGKNELIVGILNVALFMLLLNFGTALSSNPGLASVMIYTQPIFVVILEKLLGTRLNKMAVIGIVIGFLGILVSISSSNFGVGEIIALVGGLTWAGGTVFFSRKIPDSDVIKLNAFMSLISIPILIPFAPVDFYFKVSPFSFLMLISLAVLAQVVGYTIWFNMVKEMGSVVASSSSLLVPVTSYFMTFIILRDLPTSLEIVGSAITLFGVYLSLLKGKDTF